jgi:hypothetical protein
MAALTESWPRRRVVWAGLAVFIGGNLPTVVHSSFALIREPRGRRGQRGSVHTGPMNEPSWNAAYEPSRFGLKTRAGLG